MNEKVKFTLKVVIALLLLAYTFYTWRIQVDECKKWNGYIVIGQCMCPPGYFNFGGSLNTTSNVINWTGNP